MLLLDQSNVKGVGASVARKLKRIGVTAVEELAILDQRAVRVPGLSPDHVALLRRNARRYLEARRTRDLRFVQGLGPSAVRKLESVGVRTIEELLELDLRSARIPGLSTAHLQRARWSARYLL